ncbi:hypothetical protein ACJX0J_013192 [Zea mays]
MAQNSPRIILYNFTIYLRPKPFGGIFTKNLALFTSTTTLTKIKYWCLELTVASTWEILIRSHDSQLIIWEMKENLYHPKAGPSEIKSLLTNASPVDSQMKNLQRVCHIFTPLVGPCCYIDFCTTFFKLLFLCTIICLYIKFKIIDCLCANINQIMSGLPVRYEIDNREKIRTPDARSSLLEVKLIGVKYAIGHLNFNNTRAMLGTAKQEK